MSKQPKTPPVPSELEPPVGSPRFAWFGGVLEGDRSKEDASLEAAVRRLADLGFGEVDLELDGPRFSVLLSGPAVKGEGLTVDVKERILRTLQEVVAAAGDGRPTESTLHCTEVFEDRTVETLFGLRGEELCAISRVRPMTAEDVARDPQRISSSALGEEINRLGRRRAIFITASLVALAAMFVWREGYIETVFSVDPIDFPVEYEEFGTRLLLTAERSWGSYRLEIVRGPTFPDSEQEIQAWQDQFESPRDRAAYQAVVGSAPLYVHLLDEESARINTAKVDLRPLFLGSSDHVVVTMPGSRRGASFVISPSETWGK